MVFLNSSLEKGSYSMINFNRISSKRLRSIWWFYTELNIRCKACQKLSSSMQGCPLYCNASIASNLNFLTQFMKFQSLLFFDVISWILLPKNRCLVFLMTSLKTFQSSSVLGDMYLVSLSQHFSFYHTLEYLLIFTYQENLYYMDSEILVILNYGFKRFFVWYT